MRAADIIQAAESQIGSPYVYGTWGKAKCSRSLRVRYANYRPSQRAVTYARCQQLRDKDQKSSCDGCKYQGLLAFDCRGFVHWCLLKAGIDIYGQTVATQWNTKSNWDERGDIAVMPDLVCAVFIRKSNGNWSHVGLHVGGGKIIHCSVEVKCDQVGGERNWMHYAIPAGLYSAEEIAAAHKGGYMRILKKGMRGEDVRELQSMLNAAGFDCGKADGIFGANTEAALKQFQKKNGLAVDGICGLASWNALKAATDPTAASQDDKEEDTGTAGDDVVLIKRSAIENMISRMEAMQQQIDGMAYTARGWIE